MRRTSSKFAQPGALSRVPRDIDAGVLSHAHLDHGGYLPVLVRDGFRGQIICTKPTRDLAEIMLLDSAHLLEEEARCANLLDYRKHKPARPLDTVADVRRCLKQFAPLDWGQRHRVGPVNVELSRAGHLLGAAVITLTHRRRRLVFNGDLRRRDDLLVAPPAMICTADVLLVESTYGNRLHPRVSVPDVPAEIIRHTAAGGGTDAVIRGQARAGIAAVPGWPKEGGGHS